MMLGSEAARLASSAALAGSHWPAAAVASSQASNSMTKLPTLRLTSSADVPGTINESDRQFSCGRHKQALSFRPVSASETAARPEAAATGRPAVFLDRDGVINENLAGRYVEAWATFRFLPGAVAAIAALKRAGYPVVVV